MTSDLYTLVKGSGLAAAVNGGVYLQGMRPRDSRAEDIVVSYVAGQPGEIQTIIAYINIFIPDIDPWQNGVLVEDAQRCSDLEEAGAAFVEALTCAVSNYRVRLYDNIHTSDVPDTHQHFVCIPLRLEYWSHGDAADVADYPIIINSTSYFKVQK